jgi:uroporphyrinogen decarboxylase
MRQAGRYLPEYRATRAKAGSFMGLATNPELACEVTLQPLERFDLDAAILFSDILTVPDAMGLGLHFVEGEGPKFERPVSSAADVAKLGGAGHGFAAALRHGCAAPDPARTRRPRAADRLLRQPWTLACYMIEGGGSDNFSKIKAMMLREPAAAASPAGRGQRRGDRLPVGAARRRRAGAAGVRYLGRRARPAPLSRISRCATCARSPKACSAAKARSARR